MDKFMFKSAEYNELLVPFVDSILIEYNKLKSSQRYANKIHFICSRMCSFTSFLKNAVKHVPTLSVMYNRKRKIIFLNTEPQVV